MSPKILNILSAALLAGRLAMAASPASGDPLGRSVIAGGIAVYLGIMPAEVLPAHPGRYPRHEGSKIPAGKNVYHVLLALLTTRPGGPHRRRRRRCHGGAAGPRRRQEAPRYDHRRRRRDLLQ